MTGVHVSVDWNAADDYSTTVAATLLSGRSELTDIQRETYNGLFVINNDYFYIQPPTLETHSYVKYRTALITGGVCVLRDKAIRGEISAEEFWTGYEKLKAEGLSEVIEEGAENYRNMISGGEKN